MAVSLGFHIVFAAIGVALPALMVIAEWRHLRTRDPVYLDLARRWAKGTSILFAVGAVSGTVLSFELGLLWPRFMEFSGAIIGMPFSLEGFAFFTEAIFLGIYLYGRDRVPPRVHFAAGVAVAISGTASAFFVTLANAWMNTPAGFRMQDGKPVDVRPFQAMFSPNAASEVIHVILSSYLATASAMLAIHAFLLLRNPQSRFHRAAFSIAGWVFAVTALLQPVSGDFSARMVARNQPAKLAALEGQFETERGAPLRVGGFPDPATRTTRFALEIPYGLSLLAFHDPHAQVQGLDALPEHDWPDTRVVHVAFQIMVGCGSLLALYALVWLVRRRNPTPALLKAAVACGPLGFVALEAGWTVTEAGRQPWTVYGLVRTADAATKVTGLVTPFFLFTALYVLLGVVVATLLWQQFVRSVHEA
jgi:cytochrome d ubiquinol oxidase subunit I